MDKRAKIYLGAIIVLSVLAILSEFSKPKDINWIPTYNATHKIPYGTYVFHKELPEVFPSKTVLKSTIQPIYKVKDSSLQNSSYLFINSDISFGKDELNAILDWVSEGNTLLMASHYFEDQLLDTLGITMNSIPAFKSRNKKITISATATNDSGFFDKKMSIDYFDTLATNTKTLSKLSLADTDTTYTVGIQEKFNKGSIVLSSTPEVFTNYFLLKDTNYKVTETYLNQLNGDTLLLDQYYINGKIIYTSPLYLFLQNKQLKYAYYFLLIALFVFIFFEAKRKQRAIPIVTPLTNQTIAFTRVIGDMYYQKSQYKEICSEKIQMFLTNIRQKHQLDTTDIHIGFYENLASKTENSLEATQHLFNFIRSLQEKENCTKEDLVQLNQLIEAYNI